jgi:hypothetical protein
MVGGETRTAFDLYQLLAQLPAVAGRQRRKRRQPPISLIHINFPLRD